MAQSVASHVAALRSEHGYPSTDALWRNRGSGMMDTPRRQRDREQEMKKLQQSMLAYSEKVKQVNLEREAMRSTGKYGKDLQVNASNIARSSSLPRMSKRDRRMQWLRDHFSRSNEECVNYCRDRLQMDNAVNVEDPQERPSRPSKRKEGLQNENAKVDSRKVLDKNDQIEQKERKNDTVRASEANIASDEGSDTERTCDTVKSNKTDKSDLAEAVHISQMKGQVKSKSVRIVTQPEYSDQCRENQDVSGDKSETDDQSSGSADVEFKDRNLHGYYGRSNQGVGKTQQDKLEEQFFSPQQMRNINSDETWSQGAPLGHTSVGPYSDGLKQHWDARKKNLSAKATRKAKRRQQRVGVLKTELYAIPENGVYVGPKSLKISPGPKRDRVPRTEESVRDRFPIHNNPASNVEIVKDANASKEKMVINIRILREPKPKSNEEMILATEAIRRIHNSLPEGTRLLLPPLVVGKKPRKVKRLRFLREG